MKYPEIHNCAELTVFVDKIGFLPLLSSGIAGWSAEDIVDEDCQYVKLPDGGWEWPLWEWKSSVIQESGCAYGKFFNKKAGFISKDWWPDFCNWRRHIIPYPTQGSIEESILLTLHEKGNKKRPLLTQQITPKAETRFRLVLCRVGLARQTVTIQRRCSRTIFF